MLSLLLVLKLITYENVRYLLYGEEMVTAKHSNGISHTPTYKSTVFVILESDEFLISCSMLTIFYGGGVIFNHMLYLSNTRLNIDKYNALPCLNKHIS